MIEKADSNNDGLVSKEDFYIMMTKKTFDWMFMIILNYLYII